MRCSLTVARRRNFLALHRFALAGALGVFLLSQVACGKDSDGPSGPASPGAFTIVAKEVPNSVGTTSLKFEWTGGKIYKLGRTRASATPGVNIVMWSWETDPTLGPSGSIMYGDTPFLVDCDIHKCDASPLSRGVAYTVRVYRTPTEWAEGTFTL